MDLQTAIRRMPRKLRLGAFDYAVVVWDGESDDWGQIDQDNHTISIWPNEMPSTNHLVSILIHEILHSFYNEATQIGGEETTVSVFSERLVDLFRDNPKLLTWIKKGLK